MATWAANQSAPQVVGGDMVSCRRQGTAEKRLRWRINRRRSTHGTFNFRNRQRTRIFKVYSVKSIPRIHGWWEKTSDQPNCKGQLALNERGVRRLSRIVRSQRSQTLAQITTQLNQGAIRTDSKRTVQRSLHCMGLRSHGPTRVPLLNSRHRAARLAWARELREWTLEHWKGVAWSDEFRFRLLHADGRLRISRQAHEAMDPACQVGTEQIHGTQSWSGVFSLGSFWDL
ncbi:hypothetical protein AVEN_225137-1 [Araneus ventricosus]|uniref:Transposase Tc1-like domain-containing protein n=1 Tax=Araneus ventricosus TaxID=182803 RepID=A0A4Y2TBY8_ARAVE|nr:hypothetical protein AVEN_225137-1 [Araneus ventricosus]